MPPWIHSDNAAVLDRRKGLLGRSRVAALAGAYVLIGVSVVLTALMFAAIANVGSKVHPSASVTTLESGNSGVQVVHSDPLSLQQVEAFLSQPGRVMLNGQSAIALPIAGQGVPLALDGTLNSGDTLHVCTTLPADTVELTLLDMVSGEQLAKQVFASPPLCGT